MPFGREGGSGSGRETPAVNRGWSCFVRGPEDGLRVFAVLEAAPRKLGIDGGSGRKRTESGENALREPLGGVGVDGARSFVRISSPSLRSSSSRKAERRAPYDTYACLSEVVAC